MRFNLYRQNTVLNDFINFLKARGRFKDIEFIDNSVQAIPRIPDFPKLIFYIEESRTDQQYILEIHGNESAVMNREIQEFFNLNQLGLKQIKIIYIISNQKYPLAIQIEGINSAFDELNDSILTLLENENLVVETTQKILIFSPSTVSNAEIPLRPQQTKYPQKQTQNTSSRKSVFKTDTIKSQEETEAYSNEIILEKNIKNDFLEVDEESHDERPELFEEKKVEADISEEELFRSPSSGLIKTSEPSSENDSDLFHPSPPQKDYSDDVAPYLKQTTTLFRKDNWEEDLPTEFEMEILERTYMRIKHRTKPEILAKDMELSVDEAERHLRNLISKGLLRTQVGWFIIKKSHLPFFKNTFAENDRKKKKKSARISRVGEGLTPEEIATINAIKSRPNLKAQSNLLTRPTGLKQSVLKEVLRNLVDKGILRVSYGWYILKDKNILEHKRSEPSGLINQPIVDYRIPKGLKLNSAEEKIIYALLQRPQNKAQSNLLTTDVKLPKDQIKQVLRDLVDKDICKVTYGWYMLKNPELFHK